MIRKDIGNRMKAYLNLFDGTQDELFIRLIDKQEDDVHAVYMDAVAYRALDPEFGAKIEIELENVKSWMADYRHNEFWCRPAFGESLAEIPNETQGLIYEKEDGTFGVILPVVSEKYKCVLAGGTNKEGKEVVVAKLFSWFEGMSDCKGLAFLWAEGDNPYEMMEKCAEASAK